jgi:hypothetical protein
MEEQDRTNEGLGLRVSRAMLNADNNLSEPRHEAAFFYGLFLRGCPLEKLRADIDVPPHTLERMQRLALTDPWYQTTVERILNYRKEVLAIFDSLVFRQMESPSRLQ